MRKRLTAAICACLAVFGLASPSVPVHAAEKVTYAWPGVITPGIAFLAFAKELGFFADEGIELDVVILQGSGVILPQLVNGSIFSSYVSPDLLVISRQP